MGSAGPVERPQAGRQVSDEVGSAVTVLAAGDAASAPTEPGRAGARPAGRAFAVGARVADRYQVLRFIARGGMGEVYEVTDTALDTPVALKTLRADLAGDPEALARFRREVLVARQVTHPGVCRVFDYGVDRRPGGEETAFLTMELLGGETLDQALRRRGRLPPEEVRDLARQLGAALTAAHQAGIVHRDFKSANVFLVPGEAAPDASGGSPARSRAVIADFGLAFAASGARLTSATGTMMSGTPAYMAPEQVQGLPEITKAADLYALGVVLFELCTGRLPFVGDSAAATALMRLSRLPPVPSTVVPGLDPVFDRVILRCLERAPGQRYASGDEVAEALLRPAPATPTPQLSAQERRRLGNADTAAQSTVATGSPAARRGGAWWRLGAIAALVSGAFALGHVLRSPPPPGPAATSTARTTKTATATADRTAGKTATAVSGPINPTTQDARARALIEQGSALRARADLPGADRTFLSGLALPGLTPVRRSHLLAERGVTLVEDGRLGDGEQLLRQALTLARSGQQRGTAIKILGHLSEVAYLRDRATEAQLLMREQYPLFGEVRNNADALRVLTRLHLDRGDGNAARLAGSPGLDRARSEREPDDILLARVLLFRAEALWLDRIDRRELGVLRAELIREGTGQLVRWETALELARALSALSHPTAEDRRTARELIAGVRTGAPRTARLLLLRTRLAGHELARAEGRLVAARVNHLVDEATRLGYLRIAARARALLAKR